MKTVLTLFSACVLLSCEKVDADFDWIEVEGGSCVFGSDKGMENEGPQLSIPVEEFSLSTHEISNAQFEEFVEQTGYITDAEHRGKSWVYTTRWEEVKGANWRHPLGTSSSIREGMDLPVVHVSYRDAMAYCRWKGVRLPTEVEFEYAVQQNLQLLETLNIDWDKDSYPGSAPVNSCSKTKHGFYHLQGNVWEWCADVYNYEIHDKWSRKSPKEYRYSGVSFDPLKPAKDTLRVIKGGSFICQPGYCAGYLSYARQSCEQSASYFHIGFRVAKDKE
jgi:formylglycine-generating enzyme required for sulfatase activity